ncbi:helix-turn-helix transcriptional regulator [Dactylosporangium sp. AC04546]|uniref:helix-turn-helix transcriptional regulator n=1 Tax=Dactylosporangium sp. AC04546 TaxID=2862460 RepID=UPI001EDE0694|nr:helix-turn-helix transcriptional regulator [Dactylosporangium sp. AC04546]WVK83270.1 helix-turn-helix transcriptional regulator [Dactylosporangium sp. AC04546]
MGDRKQVQTDIRRQIREFLTTRRARLTPEQAGLPVYGGNRRVKGLRREEVATLAGISVEYYIRLERGDAAGVSEGVLEGINHALQLNEAERAHLSDLVRACGDNRPLKLVSARPSLRPPVQRIIDSMTTTAAVVHNGRLDVLGANALGRALYEPMYADPTRPVNTARFAFLDPQARTFWRDWERIAADSANLLRAEAGRNPCDHDLTELIGELSTRSEDFRVRWARADVRIHTSGVKRVRHPVVGDLELPYESTPLLADPGQILLMYTAEPDTPSADALRLLASWAASQPSWDGA